MNHQDVLLQEIRKIIGPLVSLNDEIAKVLQISYDAAHRRVALKSKFTIDETVNLCKHYSISMDKLVYFKEQIVMEKTKIIKNKSDFSAYFEKTNELIAPLNAAETTIYYAAKDIPMKYAAANSLFSKFKFYIWFTLLNNEQNTNFEQFTLPESFNTQPIKHFFDQATIIEIWNDTTITSSLQQLFYFYEAGMIEIKNALLILNDILQIIQNIEANCESNSDKYLLYFNELQILNNAALFVAPNKTLFFLPYNALGYFATSDRKTCLEQHEYYKNLLSNSKLLNQSGKRDRKLFFSKMYQKIDVYSSKIND